MITPAAGSKPVTMKKLLVIKKPKTTTESENSMSLLRLGPEYERNRSEDKEQNSREFLILTVGIIKQNLLFQKL